MPFHPYLFFDGTCGEAFDFYKDVFGGELFKMPFAEVPADEGGTDGSERLAHAALMFEGHLLMGSDFGPEDIAERAAGMYVNFGTSDEAEARRVFAALADGGEVESEIGPTFFSPAFGVCRDRFGTPWMVSTDDPNAGGPPE